MACRSDREIHRRCIVEVPYAQIQTSLIEVATGPSLSTYAMSKRNCNSVPLLAPWAKGSLHARIKKPDKTRGGPPYYGTSD